MKALALMPFGEPFNDVFDAMRRACESASSGLPHAVECERIDERMGATFRIVDKLIEKIRASSFCIADLTGRNQNVFWELGFAMALEKPVVLITQERDTVGFDLKDLMNIEYSRTNLRALESALSEAIEGYAKTNANRPSIASFAEAMHSSSGSPTYVLDSDYTIHYMNEAAAALFAPAHGHSQSWIGKSLRDFMNSFSQRLKNLPIIEKNLQIQNEEIFGLVQTQNPGAIRPYNVERIVFDSVEYGTLELQKTGVAVRDPSSEQITGWVVSFNIVRAHEPEKFEQFHFKHRFLIEGQMFKQTGGALTNEVRSAALSASPRWPDSPQIDDWVSIGCHDPRLAKAADYAQKQNCFDFCASVMKNDDRYGLTSVQHLDEWFFDYTNAEYIMMRTPDTGELVGVFRIHLGTDVGHYPAIEDWVLQRVSEQKAFADVGAYIHPKIEDGPRRRCLARMLGWALRICERNSQAFLYAQVPTNLAPTFEKFLFRRAGTDFKCPGWRQPSWTPFALQARLYSSLGEDRDRTEPVGSAQVDREFIDIATHSYRHRANLDSRTV